MPGNRVARVGSKTRATLGARLAARRARRFVGREAQLEAFAAFAEPASPYRLWFISGPGGSGKSALLRRMHDDARTLESPAVLLDARRVGANPPAVRSAVAAAVGDRTLPAFCAEHARPLLLVDTFEHWQPLVDWLRQEFLPDLPPSLGLIFAGRFDPGPEWQEDVRWPATVQVTRLPALSEQECMRYLDHRDVPNRNAQALAVFSKGNALALAMAADTIADGGNLDLAADSGWSLYQTLLDSLAREARDSDERLALDACAVAYQLTKGLLAHVFGRGDVQALFEWLAGLSFIDHGPQGLYPHDIVRDALMQTMPRRAPGRYEWLARTVVNWVVDRMESEPDLIPAAAAQVGAEGMYALRQVAVVQYYLHAEGSDSLYVDRVRDDDWRALAAMTRRHEGDESCAWFEFWRARFPDNVTVIRGIQGEPRAYVLRLDMAQLDAADREADPLTRRLWRFIRERIQPTPGEHMVCNRFWVNYDYRAFGSPEKTQMMMAITNYNLTTPGLRLTAQVFGTRTPSWPQQARAIGLRLVDEQAIAVGEHSYHIFYNDWLRESPMRYYRLFAERCIGFEQAMRGAAPTAPASTRLEHAAFRDGALTALRHLHRPAALADNPLLACAAVAAGSDHNADGDTRVQRLIDLLSAAIDALKQQGKGRYHEILRRTYVEPARSQQEAAAALGMAYSSYRRNLAAAREALVAELWRREQACRA